MDESSLIETILGVVSALFAGLLGLLGWHGKRVAGDVDGLKERTTRLEVIAVNLEDIRKVLREEVGIHIRDGDRRIDRVEQSLDKLNERLDDMTRHMPRRVTDKDPDETS